MNDSHDVRRGGLFFNWRFLRVTALVTVVCFTFEQFAYGSGVSEVGNQYLNQPTQTTGDLNKLDSGTGPSAKTPPTAIDFLMQRANSISSSTSTDVASEIASSLTYRPAKLKDGTVYEYFSNGNLKSETRDGTVIQYSPKGGVTSIEYISGKDEQGNPVKTKLEYEFDSTENQVRILDQDGKILQVISVPAAQPADLTRALTVKLKDGVDGIYVNQQLVEIRTQSGIRVTDFELSDTYEFKYAWIHYQDGSKEFVRDGKTLRKILADGTIQDFSYDGSLVREILKDSADVLYYQYLKRSARDKTELYQTRVISKSGAVTIYDELGFLKAVAGSSADGKMINMFYYRRSKVQNEWVVTLANQSVSQKRDAPLPNYVTELHYDAETKNINRISLRDGGWVVFTDGHPEKAYDAAGNVAVYDFDYQAGMPVAGLKIQKDLWEVSFSKTDDPKVEKDTEGYLQSITSKDGSVKLNYNRELTSNGKQMHVFLENTEYSQKVVKHCYYDIESKLVDGKQTETIQLVKIVFSDESWIELSNGLAVSRAYDSSGKLVANNVLKSPLALGLELKVLSTDQEFNDAGFLRRITLNGSNQGSGNSIDRNVGSNSDVDLILQIAGLRTLTEFELNADGTIKNGTLVSTDGIRQIYENSKLIRLETSDGKTYQVEDQGSTKKAFLAWWNLSDGTTVYFKNKVVEKIVFADKTEINTIVMNGNKQLVSYVKQFSSAFSILYDLKGVAQEVWTVTGSGDAKKVMKEKVEYIKEGDTLKEIAFQEIKGRDEKGNDIKGARRIFNAQGVLVRIESGGVVAEIQDGKITKLTTSFGIIENPKFDEAGVLTGEIVLADASRVKVVKGVLTEIVRSNGTRISYENGEISKIRTENQEYTLIYDRTKDVLNNIKIQMLALNGTYIFPLIPYLSNIDANAGAQLEQDVVIHDYKLEGTAYIDTNNFKIGDGSVYLNGTQNGYIRIPDGGADDFQYRDQDFTVEMWVNLDQINKKQVLWTQYTGRDRGNNNNMVLNVSEDNTIRAYLEVGSPLHDSENSISKTQLEAHRWYHIALVRDGQDLKLFIDGKLEFKVTMTAFAPPW